MENDTKKILDIFEEENVISPDDSADQNLENRTVIEDNREETGDRMHAVMEGEEVPSDIKEWNLETIDQDVVKKIVGFFRTFGKYKDIKSINEIPTSEKIPIEIEGLKKIKFISSILSKLSYILFADSSKQQQLARQYLCYLEEGKSKDEAKKLILEEYKKRKEQKEQEKELDIKEWNLETIDQDVIKKMVKFFQTTGKYKNIKSINEISTGEIIWVEIESLKKIRFANILKKLSATLFANSGNRQLTRQYLYYLEEGKTKDEAIKEIQEVFAQQEKATKEALTQQASSHLRLIFPTKESILLLKTTWGLTDLDVINLLYLTFPYLRSNPHVPGVLDDMQREEVGPPPPPKVEINMDAVLESKEATELMLGFVYDKYIPIYREKGYEALKNEIETVINPGSQGWEKKLAKKFLKQVKKIDAVDFSSFSQNIPIRPNQKEAVFRILNRKRTFIAQPIDSGKSYSFYGAKRIREETKNHGTRMPTLIVTTNENVNDFACKIAHLEGIFDHKPEDVRPEQLERLQKDLREKGILVVNDTTNPEDIDHKKFHTILVGQSKLSQSKRFRAPLRGYPAELVCLDESHMFKNNETLTLREILRLVCRYDRYKKQKVVTMTATPMMSNLRDFISQILVCDPDTILPLLTEKAQAEFKKSKEKNRLFEEYFYTAISRFIQTIFEKPEFIRNFVRRFFLIDRVPEFQMEDYIERVAASDEEKQKVHDIRENKGHAQGDLVENDTADKRRKIREFLMEPHGSKYQHCAEIIRKEKPERLCISTDSIKKSFTRAHKDKSSWGEALRKDFGEEYDIVELDGDVPQIERPKLIEQWRNGNKKCILLVNMEVVNFGLNLTCGDKEIELIMADSPWTSGEIMQFFGRFEREGQTASVRKHILQTDIDAEKARHEYTQDVHNLLYTLMRGEPIQQNLESVLRAMRAHEGLSKLNTSVSSDYQNLIKIYGFQRFCNYKNNIKKMREEMQKKDHPFEDKSMADFIREFYEREMKYADRYPSLSSNLFVLEHLIQQGFSGNLLDVCAGVGSLRQLYEMRRQKDGENMPEMHIMSTDVIADLLQTPDGVVADTANLPLKDDSVEMLTNLFGAHLFTDKKYNFTKGTEKALDEMVRVTEPGGKILMTIPLPTEKLLQYPRKRKGKHGKDESQKEDEPRGMPLNRYTRVLKQLQKYLRGRAHFTDASKICSYQHLDGRHYNFAFIEMEKEEATETTHEAKRSASSL